MLTTPSDSPASVKVSPSRRMLSEFSGDALSTTVQPASSAGIILTRAAEYGEFHGMTAATTPIGSRRTTVPDEPSRSSQPKFFAASRYAAACRSSAGAPHVVNHSGAPFSALISAAASPARSARNFV